MTASTWNHNWQLELDDKCASYGRGGRIHLLIREH